jgi:glycolate oxidase
MDLAIGLGGTITGEHGVGRLKRPWLAGQLGPEAMELSQRIKRALDPDGILNPRVTLQADPCRRRNPELPSTYVE